MAARALAGLRLAHPEAFGIRLKRGRDYLHSPDPHYLEKLADIMVALTQALTAKGRVVLVFLDECSF